MSEGQEAKRQLALAKWIGDEMHGMRDAATLIPLGHHSSFGVVPLGLNYWYDGRICDLAWWAVGKQIELASTRLAHVIDHAWLAGFSAQPHEPWALVTEPYIAADDAGTLAARAEMAMEEWLITVRHLPASQSSWNPGRCPPIIATIENGGVDTFLRRAIPWAMERLA